MIKPTNLTNTLSTHIFNQLSIPYSRSLAVIVKLRMSMHAFNPAARGALSVEYASQQHPDDSED